MFTDIATIDGPPASGKTTMAEMIAKKLGLIHLDSGAIFRTITLNCIRTNVDFTNSDEIIDSLSNLDIKFTSEKIMLNKEDVSREIRTTKVTNSVKHLSHLPKVREFVTNFQLSCTKSSGVVTDGRKVGTEVFPQAKVKFFLIADQKVRAQRRFLQQKEFNPEVSFEEVFADLRHREDYEIEHGVLLVPENPIIIDNTNMSINETLKLMLSYLK